MRRGIWYLFTIVQLCFGVVSQAQNINTIAGGGAGGGVDGLGNGLTANNAIFGNFCGIAFDGLGNLYIADKDHHIVRKIAANTNVITVVAGTGTQGFAGDNGQATNAKLNSPGWLAFDAHNNLYISDRANHRIRKVDVAGIITTFAGNGIATFSGDGGKADTASINAPQGICIDRWGYMFIADGGNSRIRRIDTDGVISTFAGIGTAGFSGDGANALSAEFGGVYGMSADSQGTVYVADWGNHRVRKIDRSTGLINSIIGNGSSVYSSDSVQATITGCDPFDVFVSKTADIIVADYSNNRIRKVDNGGVIFTISGNGATGFSGDGGLATLAKLNRPAGIILDTCGNLYIADNQNKRIRKVTFNPSCPITDTTTVDTTDTSTAVLNIMPKDNDVHIYPNPAKENVTVSYNGSAAEISVMNTLGQTLIKERSSGHKAVLNLSRLRDGVYFIMVKDEGGGTYKRIKFVKE